MRLISCYIENFGGLQQFTYEFQSGLNTILEENGWGKTTFAAFLKAMFYGLERTTKRSLDENERKKYEPWNGGAYGGNLVFEANGTRYRVERFFGGKDKEDTFALYDEGTGLVSNEYSEHIGEEMFGIDRIAFEQSIFMKQGMYAVSMTDSVASKMSGLMASGDDVDCYEKACARIESEMKIYKKIGNKGCIPELTEEIASLNKKIAEGKQIAAAMPEWREREQRYIRETESLYQKKEALKAQMLKVAELAAMQEKQKHYNLLLAETNSLEKRVEELDKYFLTGVPETEELEEYRKKMFHYSREDEGEPVVKTEFKYPDLAKIVQRSPLTEEELDACEAKWNELRTKRNLLDKKEMQLQVLQMREDEQKKETQYSIRNTKIKQRICIAAAVLAVIATVVLYVAIGKWYYLIAAVLCFGLAVTAVMFGIRGRRLFRMQECENEELLKQKEECSELQKNIEQIKKALLMYLQAYPIETEEEIPAVINKLRITVMEIKSEKDKVREYKLADAKRREQKAGLQEELLLFIRRFYPDEKEIKEYLLSEIERKRSEYLNLNDQYIAKRQQLAATEKVEWKPQEELLSMEELQTRERTYEQEISNLENGLRQVRRTISDYEEILEACEKFEMEKHDSEELLEEYTRKYKLLDKTLKYLKSAQNDFSSRYLKKMNEGFAEYAELFRKDTFARSALDVKLSVKTDEGGVKRDIGYYSTGARETMELCTRLALIEALFEKEQPFVVLDDPFVNLDTKSLEGARDVLCRIAEKYQLIYFTCHPSRQ